MISSESSFSKKLISKLFAGFIVVSLIGLADAIWLTKSYYEGNITCTALSGCLEVLKSPYAAIAGIPVALLGALFYALILIMTIYYLYQKNKISLKVLAMLPPLGFLFSLWLVYLQIVVIKAICIYCMLSATTATILFILSLILIAKTKKPVG